MKTRSWLLWLVAFVLTLLSAAYQRMAGPSYPVKGTVVVNSVQVAFRLPRSHGGEGDAEIRLNVPDRDVGGLVELRRFRSRDSWSRQALTRAGDTLIAQIPHQPPAGKVMYRILLGRDEGPPVALTPEPVIIRFRGGVPAFVLVSHIALIFAGMLFSTRTGFEALFKRPHAYRLTLWTIACLALGGLVLGPVIQKYAFGAYWTGWPFGHDLTDNKIAVTMVFWVVALWRLRKKGRGRGWAIAASLVTLLALLIPHSVLGSELDYTQMPH